MLSKNIILPEYWELIESTFCALKNLGGSGTNSEILNEVVHLLNISDESASVKHSSRDGSIYYGCTELDYRLRWCRTLLKNQGIIINVSRSVWMISSQYKTQESVDGHSVFNNRRIKEPSTSSKSQKISDDIIDEEIFSSEDVSYADELAAKNKNVVKKELLTILNALSPTKFESVVLILFRDYFQFELTKTKASHDGGVDLSGTVKVLNSYMTIKVAVQCKRYCDKNRVGASLIRDLRGSLEPNQEGIFVTRGSFTNDAIKEATNPDGNRQKITLIDGTQLVDMMIEKGIGCYQIIEVNNDFFDGLSDDC